MQRRGRTFLLAVFGVAAASACTGAAGRTKPLPNDGPLVRKTIRTDVQPCAPVSGFGAIWVSNFGSGTLQRINPRTNKVTGRVKIGARPCGLAVGAGAVWINGYGTNSVERVDPQMLKLTAHIKVGSAPFDVLFADGDVWTTNQLDQNVMRIDPDANRIVATIPIGEGAAGLGFAAGSVWVGSSGSSVFRIDPASNAVTKIPTGKKNPAWLATRDDQVWVSSVLGNVVVRIDPKTNRVANVVKVRSSPVDGVVDTRGLVWIPNRGDNSVSIIDAPSATLVTTIRVGATPFVLNDGFGDIWSPSYGGSDVRRLRAPRIVSATLAENASSGQSGTVRLIAVGRKTTRVVVTLAGAPASGEVVHVHGGRCGRFRPAGFAPWTLKNGRGSALVKTPIRTLAAGRNALDVHRTRGEQAYVACANLG